MPTDAAGAALPLMLDAWGPASWPKRWVLHWRQQPVLCAAVLREQGSMTRLMLERALASRGLAQQVRLEVGSREAAREAIAAGIGIGVVLDGELGGDERLVAVPIEAPSILGGVYAAALTESLDLPAVSAFIEAGRTGGRDG